MKKNTFYIIAFILLFQSNFGVAQISEGFETSSCNDESFAFLNNCFSDWINTSGSADISSNHPGILPAQGSKYVHMYAKWRGGCFNSVLNNRSEGIALEYNFNSNKTYTITYALRWKKGHCASTNAKWILTNGLPNQSGSWTNCANDGGVTPAIPSNHQVVKTHNITSTSNQWQYFEVTFTPNSNFSQLWLRPEATNGGCHTTGEYNSDIYLDDFELINCSDLNYTTQFSLSAHSDFAGNVTVNTTAFTNPVAVNHWWDVFYAPNGNTSGDTEVPDNPYQVFTSTSSFSNNLYINEWYYIKHGIWNDCINWRETRKRFRVQVAQKNGKNTYVVEMEDIPFAPSEAYLSEMANVVNNPEHNLEHPEIGNTRQITTHSVKNFPNPFANESFIEFKLDQKATINLSIYDLTGRVVQTIATDEFLDAGIHQRVVRADDLVEGAYFYKLHIGDRFYSGKMLLQR